MSDRSPWATQSDRVWTLSPTAPFFAVSPDDAHLAWCEAPDHRSVHVTELATMRTVTTLVGAPASALHWSSPETLRVLRQTGHDATMHAMAQRRSHARSALLSPRARRALALAITRAERCCTRD